MATVENLHDLTNRRAMYEIPVKPADEKKPVKIPVTILGHRVAYGRIELLVAPINGSGTFYAHYLSQGKKRKVESLLEIEPS
jgi:hypothetical protein